MGAGTRPAPTLPSRPPPALRAPSARPTAHLPGEGAQRARRQEAALETWQQAYGLRALLRRHGGAGRGRGVARETERQWGGAQRTWGGAEAGPGRGRGQAPLGAWEAGPGSDGGGLGLERRSQGFGAKGGQGGRRRLCGR